MFERLRYIYTYLYALCSVGYAETIELGDFLAVRGGSKNNLFHIGVGLDRLEI